MKLLPSPTFARRQMRADDTLGQGVDAALVIAAFFGIGFGLDRWLGTTPWMSITCFLLAAVGLFASWKARYTTRMEALEAQRKHDVGGNRQAATNASSSES